MAGPRPRGLVSLGKIVGLFGVRGWLKVYSETRPREGILQYNPWQVCVAGVWREMKLGEGRRQGPGVVVRFEGIDERSAAAELVGAEVAVRLEQLPAPVTGEYYWAQLEGLKVVNREGVDLGAVSHLFETGANDVLVVRGERERLIPFTRHAIDKVDLEGGVIRVDWDPAD